MLRSDCRYPIVSTRGVVKLCKTSFRHQPVKIGIGPMKTLKRQSRNVQLESWEVGGELLDILSRGLYSDAKDALREYVQNGVDAGAKDVRIMVDGSQVVITDDGHGMDDEGIRAARRFGMSDKSPNHMVGYRGIGIYSAFGICEEMTITSHKADTPALVGWRFEFGAMRSVLEADKSSDVRQGIGLADLLYQYTHLITEPYTGDRQESFTVVEIDGINEEYAAQLNNAAEVNDYLLNTIPVRFPATSYGKTVNNRLVKHAELNPVRITLSIADETDFEIIPPIAPEVYEVEHDWINGSDGKPLAFVWYALTNSGRQLPSSNGSSVGGFLMKIKGFTLGDRLSLKPLWPALGGRTLYHHYTGEVHILASAGLFPNAARDGLEATDNKQLFLKNASDFFYPLSRKARLMQAKTRAERLLQGFDAAIEQLSVRRHAPNEDAFEVYKDSVDNLADLERVVQEIRTHSRKPRGRPRISLSDIQRDALNSVLQRLDTAITRLNSVVAGTQRRTQRRHTNRRTGTAQPPPQEDLLNKAHAAISSLTRQSSDVRLKNAAEALLPLIGLRAIHRAIAILDDLKAAGIELGGDVESSRKELRSSVGWSPLAPVSLEEALTQRGLSLETEREANIIRAIDRGLIASLGGRGKSYETVVRAIAETISEDLGS